MSPILFLSTATGSPKNASLGGGEFFAREFLGHLSKQGWKITLVCPPSNPLLKDADLMAAMDSCITLDIATKIRQPIKSLRILFRWLMIVKNHRDYIFYGNAFETLKWLAVAAFVFQIKSICHLHESSYTHYASSRAKSLSRYITRFIAISKCVEDNYVIGSGISFNKISVVHNGIEFGGEVVKSESERESLFREFGLPLDKHIVMMAARTDPLKGHEVFFRAASEVLKTRSDVHFLVAGFDRGEGAQVKFHDDLVNLMHTLGLEEDLTLIGFTNKVRILIRYSDIVVVPSTSEGFGRTAIEAMAEQAPLVASRVGGLEDILHHDKDGLFFENGNSNELAKTILYLLGNPAVRDRISKQGYLTARESFSLSTMVNKIKNCLDMVLREM